MSRKITMAATLIMGFALMIFVVLPATTTGQDKDPNVRGRKLYVQYCASCHGMDAKGSGPVAPALKVAPTDLTTIAKRHGKWDGIAVEMYISGDKEVVAHGTREMPVWGAYFQSKRDRSVAALNLYALMRYLEAVQVKETISMR